MSEKQLDSLLENIKYEISLLSNSAAFIYQTLNDVSWAGFYLYQDNQLILGPFQGKTACTIIPLNRGVCGACADSATNSEIVLPIIIDQELYGVLDLDSTSFDRFSKSDQLLLEKYIQIIIKHLKRLKEEQ